LQELKLLVCSDLHGSEKASDMISEVATRDGFDAVVVCGDFTTYGSVQYVRDLAASVGTRMLGVPGNCDTADEVSVLEKLGSSLHGRSVSVGGWGFFGFGGGPPTAGNMPFEVDEREIQIGLALVARRGGVMVTHAPALGMNDLGHNGMRMGLRGILEVAREFRPRLALSGHIHEARGSCESEGTVFVNPGPAKGGYFAIVTIGQRVSVSMHGPDVRTDAELTTF
jgi:Icc-related predicted phosphoesterase